MAKPKFRPGDVVWGMAQDRNGVTKPERRPLLIIHPGPQTREQNLVCLCVSTRGGADPADPPIEMPGDAETGSTSGLFKPCRVVLLWRVLIDQRSVQKSGRVTDAFLARVVAERELAISMIRPR